jgi:hypothetical protein
MNNGGQKLLDLLKDKGYYPYPELDRIPVALTYTNNIEN